MQGATELARTKLDVLDGFAELPVCVGYRLRGEVVRDFPYTAELDGGDRLTVDRTELAEARWFFRDQVPIRKEDRVSITQDMVRAFAAGRF